MYNSIYTWYRILRPGIKLFGSTQPNMCINEMSGNRTGLFINPNINPQKNSYGTTTNRDPLSTKTPLEYENVKSLRNLGYDEIQFSLDSDDVEVLKKMINVGSDYLDRVAKFFTYCSELNLNVIVRSVMTKLNASKQQVNSLYRFISVFSCIKGWSITPAFFSQYKQQHYKKLEVDNDDLVNVYDLACQPDLPFNISLNKITDKGYELKRFETSEDYVHNNQICMANTTCISILANGDCSVCEMLYDNLDYILGNVTKSSVSKIWNSEKALKLYTMSQKNFPSSSPCSKCKVFDKCRNGFGKRVCYLDIAKSGHALWEPDPRCPHADSTDLIL